MRTLWGALGEEHRNLLEQARQVRLHAYAPYSNFLVGAAALTRSGTIYRGANFENASYGLSLCAEATCLGQAVSHGDFTVLALAVVGGPRSGAVGPVTPCGRCRQLIAEAALVAEADVLVFSSDPELAEIDVHPISELLPFAFTLP
jgi:cytidine deaminase